MIKLDFAKNKTYYLLGMGKSNHAAFKALGKAGADVRVWDDNADNLKGYEDYVCAPDKAPWSKIKAVVTAPGIKPSHPFLVTAVEKNIPVICDVDLYAQSKPSCKIVGVTGTNGKSTTTALIHHILDYDGQSQVGGNIGDPVLGLKSRVDFTVLELSSYQLERSPNLSCDVAILLNITPDHLDWHGDMDSYVGAKNKIFDRAATKIIGVDDDYGKSLCSRHRDAVPLTIYADDLPFDPAQFPRLKGVHNLQNILAAYAACAALDVDHDVIIERIRSFEGLPHRQYLARVINGVPYINDSKATNAEATKQALRAYKNIFWIAGGLPKDGGLKGLEQDLSTVTKAYLFGHARDGFSEFLTARGIACDLRETVQEVLTLAHHDAQEARGTPNGNPCVLFSPACASFDQFKNFEERGDHFCDLVNGLSDG